MAGYGFKGLKALLPPPSRRGLTLIDPSYEVLTDYRAVRSCVRDALARFANGTYAVWYPQLARRESEHLPEELKRIAPGDWLHVWLRVRAPIAGGFGLFGSGIFVFNPPWNLERTVAAVMPSLVAGLGQDENAAYGLAFRQT